MTKNIETMIAEVEKLGDQMFELNQTIAPKLAALNTKKQEMQSLLDAEIAKLASEQLKDKDYSCGTANIETGLHKIKVTVSKKVKWDEKQLIAIRQQIIDAGKNPNNFIKEKLSVGERDYQSFDPEIQKVFEPARTVEPNPPKIEIARK